MSEVKYHHSRDAEELSEARAEIKRLESEVSWLKGKIFAASIRNESAAKSFIDRVSDLIDEQDANKRANP